MEGVLVRADRVAAQTDADGRATLRLGPGNRVLLATRIGFRPDTSRIHVRAGADTMVTIVLAEQAAELEGVVVSATRSERRVEDTPLRVEIVDEEEVAEKTSMRPGSVAMLLAETGGLRVQTTSPSLGSAAVRVQGLRGRYSLLLADGLPLYGGQAGGLGLLQIPPVDLGRVEIIKGAASASALYGSSAPGGVINLVSRRPRSEREREVLVNQTSQDGPTSCSSRRRRSPSGRRSRGSSSTRARDSGSRPCARRTARRAWSACLKTLARHCCELAP